eukprot:5870622-Amphidinium_carterae.2
MPDTCSSQGSLFGRGATHLPFAIFLLCRQPLLPDLPMIWCCSPPATRAARRNSRQFVNNASTWDSLARFNGHPSPTLRLMFTATLFIS